MIRDRYLKLIFIPLLGIAIPLLSGILTYTKYSLTENLGIQLFFILLSYLIWTGCQWIHGRLRVFFKLSLNPFIKIMTISSVSAVYGAGLGGLISFLWLRMSREIFAWEYVFRFLAVTLLAILVFTLIYEILYLSKERELDNKIVDQLDHERSLAGFSVLRNELDPHFMFNALTTMSQLIYQNPGLASDFNTRLARVYKYILMNKERELISLDEELEFLKNYFFLLQVRHENRLRLDTEFRDNGRGPVMILPCSLQTLVENAVKHNEFSDEEPLRIKVCLNGQYIRITNNRKPKPYLVNSTGIGLNNLKARYKYVCNKDILIEQNPDQFAVSVPLIR